MDKMHGTFCPWPDSPNHKRDQARKWRGLCKAYRTTTFQVSGDVWKTSSSPVSFLHDIPDIPWKQVDEGKALCLSCVGNNLNISY